MGETANRGAVRSSCSQLGDQRDACGRAEDVTDLRGLGDRVKVGGRGSVAACERRKSGGLLGGVLGCAMRGERGRSLQVRPWRAIREHARRTDRFARP